MISNFTTNIKSGKRCLITIPYNLCKNYNLKLGNIILGNILGIEFFAFITGTNSSKRFTIPLEIFKKIPLGQIEVKIKLVSKRNPKTIITESKIDLYNSLPNRNKQFDWPLAIVKKGSTITVWSPQALAQIIPRYVKIDEELFEVFGLIQGEGYKKTPIGGTRIDFVNSNKEIINKILHFFQKRLDIPSSKWSAFINYVYYPKKPKNLDHKLIDYWSRKTMIPRDSFKRVNYLGGKGIRSAKFGVLHIFIPSCVLGNICLSILEIVEKLAVRNKKYASWFLRGLMAADGSATLKKYKNYNTLRIAELALENDHEKKLYFAVMKAINLKVKDYSLSSRKLCLSGWDNFLKLAQENIFKLHKVKNNKFNEG